MTTTPVLPSLPTYPEQDHIALGDYYLRHIDAMTLEGLHAKSAIAVQLAWRDAEIDRLRAIESLSRAPAEPLQSRVQPWLLACFGSAIASDRHERNHRFLEESLELVQACGCTADEAHQLVDYVYGRPVGEKDQEVGGVMITLAALCLANGLDMHDAGERELARIWTMVEKIRAKQAAKPKHSPLPIAAHPTESAGPAPAEIEADARRYRWLRENVNGGFGEAVHDDRGRDLLDGERLDQAIDAALGESHEG